MPATPLDALIALLRGALTAHNADEFAPPACLLWPDPAGEWAGAVALLLPSLPLLTLGDYAPEQGRGPALWLRAQVDGWAGAEGGPPILYLPGVRREDLAPAEVGRTGQDGQGLRLLSELTFRGVVFERSAGRPWTVANFFGKGGKGSVGLEVTQDARRGLVPLLPQLLTLPQERLTARTVTPQFLSSLAFPDLPAALLGWLSGAGDAPEGLVDAAHSEYGLNLAAGRLAVAALVAEAGGLLWERYAAHPQDYPGVRGALLAASPGYQASWDDAQLLAHAGRWPDVNEAAERELGQSLAALAGQAPATVRTEVRRLEARHGGRRVMVWARLGEAPLAGALGHLFRLADLTEKGLAGAGRDELAQAYAAHGHAADAAVLDALASVPSDAGQALVGQALAPMYRDWLERVNEAFGAAVLAGGPLPRPVSASWAARPGLAVVFVDGLRYDLAARLAGMLDALGLENALDWQYSAVPTITPCAKPAVAPAGWAFEALSGEALTLSYLGRRVTAEVLREALRRNGFIPSAEKTDPSRAAWLERGDFDRLGHSRGLRLASDLGGELERLLGGLTGLLAAGFDEVRVITDHGWLLLPGGLEKVELPASLTVFKKGRCAVLGAENASAYPTQPWTWDDAVRVTPAPGIRSFEAGETYAHGGLSLQELVVPVLTLRRGGPAPARVEVEDLRWKGNRLRLEVTGGAGLRADLRRVPADAGSSVALRPVTVGEDGHASLLVEADNLDGVAVTLVILDAGGAVVRQREVRVGENS